MNTFVVWLRALANLLFIGATWVSLFIASTPVYVLALISWLVVKPQDGKGNKIKLKEHFVYVLYAQDQAINQAMCGNPDSTISGRTGYWALAGDPVSIVMEKCINGIFFWQDEHCYNAIENDEPELYPWVF